MMNYAGMRVFVSRTTVTTVERTWRERLFTLPWRPWKWFRIEVRHAAVPADACYRVGNDLHCGEAFYERLRATVSSHTQNTQGE
jgi:hypothetical protein